MNKTFLSSLAAACLFWTLSGTVHAADAPSCETTSTAKERAAERFDQAGLMMVATLLEQQGEANFHLKYAQPKSQCIADSFKVGGATVTVMYSPWQKGPSTLLYRVNVTRSSDGGGTTDILVIYDGVTSLSAGAGLMFHVSEEHQGVISWYAMYREEPSLADVKALATRIVEGKAKPLLAVTWPKGAKEGELVAIDSARLK